MFLVDPNHPLSSLSWSLWTCKNQHMQRGWLNPFTKSLPLILEQKPGTGARGKGTSHESFSLKGKPVEMPCCLLRPVQIFQLKRKTASNKCQMWAWPRKIGLKKKVTKLITNCLVWFVNFYSSCNPSQSAWARFMVVTTPGLEEFSWLVYSSPLHSFVSTQWSAQQWGCWQVRVWLVPQICIKAWGVKQELQ